MNELRGLQGRIRIVVEKRDVRLPMGGGLRECEVAEHG